ncbi:MAG: RNA polymerase sigma factor [Thermomicrobiales bacterium]
MFEHTTRAATGSDLSILPESDESLSVRAVTDPVAFTELYRRHVDQIFGFCLLRLGDRQRAEDCTSQVFTHVIESLPRFRPEKFRSWLFTIAYHEVVDSQRRNRPTLSLEAAELDKSLHSGMEQSADQHLSLIELQSHFSRLTADQRTVIEMRLAGLTGPEISQALGKSSAWVHTTQYRAIGKLKALMTGSEIPESAR